MVSDSYETGTPEADIAAFVSVLRAAFGSVLDEQSGPAGGYQFRWTHKGLWKITVGGVLEPAPLLEGTFGYWRLAAADQRHAELALLILDAAGALPPNVSVSPVQLAAVDNAVMTSYAGAGQRPGNTGVGELTRRIRPATLLPERPPSRLPGSNTGARPGPAFTAPSGFVNGPYAGRPAEMGPGAGYAPQQVEVGPLPAPGCQTARIAGSDLPARDAAVPVTVNDIGHPIPPAETGGE